MATDERKRTARSGWKRPVVQFVVAGVLVAVAVSLLAVWFSRSVAEQEAVDQARQTNELLARAVVQPALTSGVLSEGAADLDRFDRLMRSRVVGGEALRVKIWNSDGVVVYSDEPRLIGDHFTLDPEQREVLDSGVSHAGLSTLTERENRYERPLGQVLEVYTPVDGPNGEPLLFEVYYTADQVTERASQLTKAFQPVTVGGVMLLLLLTVPLVFVLARRLSDSASARERLLAAAADASDAERRRIARDVHDGVVQDLAGTSFALSAAERELATSEVTDVPALRARLQTMAVSVRHSLTSLRSLLVEIYPPDLAGDGLGPALDDLLATAVASGVSVETDLADTDAMSPSSTALVWRTAQEAVRNALRHGRPAHLSVRVSRRDTTDSSWVLEVVDDGVGFDPSVLPERGHFGIRGLRDLASEAGGSLTVESSPGNGAVVRLEVPA